MGDYDWHIATDTNQWSDQLYRIYGHEPQSFNPTYERFLAQIHRDDRDRIRAIHEHAYATGEPYQMIERIVRPNGEVRYLSSNGQVIRDDAGTPIRMRGTCLDITDRVLAQQAQDRVAARFRSLVETFPDAIVVLDGTDRIVQANRHATELLGADPVGRHIGEILPTPPVRGDAVPGTRLDGRAVQLDVRTSALSPEADDAAVAIFLRDAAPRLAGEAMAATLREAQVRRRQALEINDNIVQGLTVALNAVEQHNGPAAGVYLERTLAAARQLMNDWLDPLTGADLQPGDLVRSQPSVLADPPPKHLPTARPLRVLIADDYDAVRGLLRRQLDQMDGYEFAGEAADGEEAVRLATILQPDVVILDLAMPVLDGLQATPLICAAVPGVRVIVLSGFDERTMAQKVLAAGAARYVEKGLRMNLSEILGDVGANA
jgi:PAS domain S-box-containing protein